MKKQYFFILLLLFVVNFQITLGATNVTPNTDLPATSTPTADGLKVKIGEYSEIISKEVLDSWVTHRNLYTINPGVFSEFENSSYCPFNKILCTITLTRNQKNHIKFIPKLEINNEAIANYLNELAKKVNHDPENAKFAVIDGKVTTFSQAKDGITLDTAKSLELLANTIISNNTSQQEITLAFDTKKAQSDYGDVNSLGVSSLLGEGISDFKGSPVNRVKNIKAAVTHFNGVLIKPGEEFSFVKTLGDVDAEHGYFPELVIKNNATEPEFGGGICQVSSTAFRAAIYSGLKITARRNHAYPVSYYNPQGMDSTVYIPNPDLKFINNTPGYILIQVKIVGTQLIFDFYGTDDGRKTTVDGPRIIEKQPDGALKATFTQHVVNKDGNEFINDVFNSNYESPYKYPHPGGPVLAAKPSNWSDQQWKDYKQTIKDMAKAAQAKH